MPDKNKACEFKKSRFETDKSKIGRKTHVIDCRATPGLGFGGGFAQRGTLSKSESNEVLILSMGPTKRHITKPVCEITYGLREADIEVSVLVLQAGIGPPAAVSDTNIGGVSSLSGITDDEIDIINNFKLLIIHLGNVPGHFVYKAKTFLERVKLDLPAIIICQAPVDFSDFEKVNIRTINMPDNTGTSGKIVDIVSGIIRGETVSSNKMEDIISKVSKQLKIASLNESKID